MLNAFRHHRGSRIGDSGNRVPPDVIGAQRLSASQRFAERASSSLPQGLSVCSTPFGITEVRGSPRSTAHEPRRCAQRLSASQRFAARLPAANSAALIRCSTPFGITEVRGLRIRTTDACSARCSTPFGITEVRGGIEHRLSLRSRAGCSTPFGITEVRGCTDDERHEQNQRVLNAFRHH